MSNKKLKITEEQYNRLLNLMTETPFDVITKQKIQVGDIVNINWHGKNNKFKVVDNNNGQIIMDNIDNDNDRVFIASTSLNGDDLDLRKIDKIKNKDKLNDIKSWPRISLKDISNIEVFRDGKLIDTVDPVSPTAEKQQKKGDDAGEVNVKPDFMDEVNNDLAIIMEQLNKEKGINFIFNNGYVNFCCLNKTYTIFDLDINKNQNSILPELNKWDTFVLELKGNPDEDNLYLVNRDIVSTNDGITYNLKFKVKAGNNSGEVIIRAINGVSILPDCNSSDEDRNEVPNEEESDEETLFDANKALEMIVNDKNFQDAFYKQPDLWSRFKADLAGKKAKGTGLITVLNIVKKYTGKAVEQKVGKGFIKNNQAKFIPTENISVKYRDDKDVIHTYDLPMVEDYIRVRRHEIDDVTQVLQKTIPDSPLSLRILVKNKTEDPNIKLCDVQVGIVSNNKAFDDKSHGGTKDVRIKFLDSDGYQAQRETQTNK